MGQCKIIRYRNPDTNKAKRLVLIIRNKMAGLFKRRRQKGQKRPVACLGRGPASLGR